MIVILILVVTVTYPVVYKHFLKECYSFLAEENLNLFSDLRDMYPTCVLQNEFNEKLPKNQLKTYATDSCILKKVSFPVLQLYCRCFPVNF